MILSFDSFNEELNNTLPKEGIDNLIDRIKRTGYISKTNKDRLIEMSGDKDILEKIINRVEKINNFFNKISINYIDDVVLDYFDATGYDYQIFFGMAYESSYSFRSDYLELTESYFKSSNKSQYLLITTLGILQEVIDTQYKEYLKKREEIKSKPIWIQHPRSRVTYDITYRINNIIKSISPCITILVKHKELQENWWLMDMDRIDGFKKTDMYSIREMIQKNLRLKRLGDFFVWDEHVIDTGEYGENYHNRKVLKANFKLKYKI